MPIHSFHLAELPALTTAPVLLRGNLGKVDGLRHSEPMAMMRLGAPTISFDRLQMRKFALFAEWDDESALTQFLSDTKLGRQLDQGWHVRLEFLRQWGELAALDNLPAQNRASLDEPVVAVTIARMKLPEMPRFLEWGKPVERQVRDDPNTTLALAAIRPPEHNFDLLNLEDGPLNG